MYFVFLASIFLNSCVMPFLNSTGSANSCYDYEYDREKEIWVDDQGQSQECSIYDYENIFPFDNQDCEVWNKGYGFKDSQMGLQIKFQRILVNNELVCVKQEYIRYNGGAVGQTSYCLIPSEEEFHLIQCPQDES